MIEELGRVDLTEYDLKVSDRTKAILGVSLGIGPGNLRLLKLSIILITFKINLSVKRKLVW